MAEIWNAVVRAGNAFPQEDEITVQQAACFFAGQSFTGVAEDSGTGALLGLYILHPNNEGRCAHIANASYAVSAGARGRGIGEQLVVHSLEKAKDFHFRLMQFNAVVNSNAGAMQLYKKLGFTRLGAIPNGFRTEAGYEDIWVFYKQL